jgi:DNA-directed RNA polymerase specialized sigma24 family protein
VAPSPECQREIADFFAAHERDVRQSVAYRVLQLPAAAIEDACQAACETLSRRRDVDLTATGRAWLVTVALHEAWRHYRRERVETPAARRWNGQRSCGSNGTGTRPTAALNSVPYVDRAPRPLRVPDERRRLLLPHAPRPVAPRWQFADAPAQTWLSSLPGGACVATWSCPVVEQLQGRLQAAGEELVGEVAVGQGSGDLQDADHEPDERERVDSRRVRRVEACCDVVGGAE